MPDNKTLFAESIGVTLTRRQIASFGPHNSERLTVMGLFNIGFPCLADVLMNHARSVQRWVPTNTSVPRVFMPGQASRQMRSHLILSAIHEQCLASIRPFIMS
jgi:hypothetical protein